MGEGPRIGWFGKARSSLFPLTLRSKLLIFTSALVVVPCALAGLIAHSNGRSSLERVIGRQLAREAGHTAERLASKLAAERETVRSFARQDLMREIRVGDIDKRVSLALATLKEGSPVRLDYLVIEKGDRVTASSNPALLGPLPFWASQGAAALDGTEVLVGPGETPAYEEGPWILIAAPIPDPDGREEVIGALIGLCRWEEITAVTRRVRFDLADIGLDTDVLVVDEAETVIGGDFSVESDAEVGRRLRFAGRSPPLPIASGSPPDHFVEARSGLLVGRATLGPGLPEWRLLISEPLAEAFRPVRRMTARLAMALGATLAGALVVAALGAGRVVRPLTELTRAIGELSRGEPRARVVPVRTGDEVGALAGAFNRMASELDRAQQDLVEAAKFSFAGELSAGVAHEVRTSLGVLRSSAQILGRSVGPEGDERKAELAALILAEVDRLSRVVNDLLSLARPREIHLEPTPLRGPLFRAVDFVEAQAREKGIRIERVGPSGDDTARCDPELIYQVALNLLVNAVQVLERGGEIEARIVGRAEGRVGFEVRDNGPGIPEDMREKVFLPFVTLREGGVGLGLTFVKRVVYEHGGRITLDTQAGRGTCIRVELPATEAAA